MCLTKKLAHMSGVLEVLLALVDCFGEYPLVMHGDHEMYSLKTLSSADRHGTFISGRLG